MSWKVVSSAGAFVFILVLLGVLFSHHGLLHLLRFNELIYLAQERVSVVEQENWKLKRQVDLLRSSSEAVLEPNVRTIFGWVKKDEIVYLEK